MYYNYNGTVVRNLSGLPDAVTDDWTNSNKHGVNRCWCKFICILAYIQCKSKIYRIAQKFRGSKFSRIAVFENFVEIISRIHCTALNTPRPYFYERDVLKFYLTRALELSFIDLAAAVKTRNLEGMPTFDVQAMVRGYHVYQHVWDVSIHEELLCARETDNLRDPFAVAVMKSHQTVGHIPVKILSAQLLAFLFQPSFQNSFSGTFLSCSPSLHQLTEVKQLRYLPQIWHEKVLLERALLEDPAT